MLTIVTLAAGWAATSATVLLGVGAVIRLREHHRR